MTTLFSETVTCNVCGTENEISTIGSTNAFGSPDLDLRPPEMQRSTMSFWVNECKGCGYVAADLSEETDIAPNDIHQASRDFRESFLSAPPTALNFLQASRWAKDHYGRAMHLLRAAWVFDDKKQAENASKARALAATSLRHALLDEDTESQPSMRAQLIDILRRSGDYSTAIDVSDALLGDSTIDDTLRQVAVFQRDKCNAHDSACYTVAEALN